MEKSARYIIIKGILVMVFFALAGFFLLNGFGKHPYAPEELESVFRERAAEQNIIGNGEEKFAYAEYGNSITFVMQTEDGERACATYGRSMFVNKYKEITFYSGASGVLALDEMTYAVSDGVIAYDVTVHFGEEVSIALGEEVRPIMYIKIMAVCLIAMGFFGLRIFRSGKKR